MNITKEHVEAAVLGGLALLDPEQDPLTVYRKHGSGLLILRSLLEAIAAGQVMLQQPQMEPPSGAELPSEDLRPGGTDPDD